ncbi:hypothetical protein LguiB_009810 [Lonicera macranthoides]
MLGNTSERIDWFGEDGVDRSCAVVYRDVTRAAPVLDVPWLLMEPVSHEIHRRSLVMSAKEMLYCSRKKFNKVTRTGNPLAKRTIAGRIVKESYGAAKQQYTFMVTPRACLWP